MEERHFEKLTKVICPSRQGMHSIVREGRCHGHWYALFTIDGRETIERAAWRDTGSGAGKGAE